MAASLKKYCAIKPHTAKPDPDHITVVPVSVSDSQLVVGGKLFKLHGVTYAKEPEETDFQTMQEMGVNALRTWGSDDKSQLLLDLAYKYKIKVLMGIWMRHGQPGPEGDDDFDWIRDRRGKKKQMTMALDVVQMHKDHPALLGWGIGNEVTLNIATSSEKVSYAKFLEKVCRAVKKLDPNHLVASISAWLTDIPYWQKYCKSIDIYGVNVYGYGVYAIQHELKKLEADKPFFLGEFGPVGEWEAQKDPNGVKEEPTDKQKYEIFADNWKNIEESSGSQFLGGFLFHFGKRLSFAGIWLNFFIEEAFRPGYWGARKAFTGKDPTHKLPSIKTLLLLEAKKPQLPGKWINAKLEFLCPGGILTKVIFYYNQRQGTRAQRDAVVPLRSELDESSKLYRIQLPNNPGLTKIYAFVEDEHANLAIASASVRVQS